MAAGAVFVHQPLDKVVMLLCCFAMGLEVGLAGFEDRAHEFGCLSTDLDDGLYFWVKVLGCPVQPGRVLLPNGAGRFQGDVEVLEGDGWPAGAELRANHDAGRHVGKQLQEDRCEWESNLCFGISQNPSARFLFGDWTEWRRAPGAEGIAFLAALKHCS